MKRGLSSLFFMNHSKGALSDNTDRRQDTSGERTDKHVCSGN